MSKLSLVRALRPLALCAALLAQGAAQAANGLILIGPPPAEGYKLSLGADLLVFPKFPGSDESRVWLIPGIEFKHHSGAFVSTDNGLGWNFGRGKELQYGVRLWPLFGRDDDALPGLPGVKDRIGGGLFANVAPLEFLVLQSSLMAGSGRNGSGLMGELGATVGAPVGPAILALTLGGSWANAEYRQSYFGVSAADAASSGLPVTTLGSGLQDLNLGLSLDAPIDDRWRLSGQLLVARLMGDAASSPITQSRQQTTLAMTLWYRFR
ncbi:MipA/OmpV family protein [Rivibacter subsaxonicus]|uniref:Outer membrane scaffolding protein for murein synthesis (MipA/OmpV family) n=1 Tax=Rivibacter subsaxonicus TaxID=457575 RepID=A0A4Q7VWR7_9BURK|nr:MipA/OmpV family protein [Rivibacter subsaxonicus]RZU01194.1 outer membrane scaffolding protein for murein synthesis (MipA/OmpV family) [Rivibacter subsaxonicus]